MRRSLEAGLVLVAITACGADEPPGSGTAGGGGAGGAEPAGCLSPEATCDCDVHRYGNGDPGHGGGPFISSGVPKATLDAETSVVADGAGLVVAVWIALQHWDPDAADGASLLAYAISHDDGATWGDPRTVPQAPGTGASDPVLAVAPDKSVRLAWLSYPVDSSSTVESVRVARIDPASEMLVDTREVDAGSTHHDKEWLGFDAHGDEVVVYVRKTASDPHQNLAVAISRDGGAFDVVTVASGAQGHNPAQPRLCTDAGSGVDAPLYASYVAVAKGTPGAVFVQRSDDRAASWSIPGDPIASNAGVMDVTCVAHGDDVWVSWLVSTESLGDGFVDGLYLKNPLGSAVQVARSGDRGVTWGAPVTAAVAAQGETVMLPQMILAATGSLHVLHYRGRELEPGELADAVSVDGGASWSSTGLATVGPLTRWRDSPCWLGDYFGVSLVGTMAHVAYSSAEASPGRSHVKYLAFPAP